MYVQLKGSALKLTEARNYVYNYMAVNLEELYVLKESIIYRRLFSIVAVFKDCICNCQTEQHCND